MMQATAGDGGLMEPVRGTLRHHHRTGLGQTRLSAYATGEQERHFRSTQCQTQVPAGGGRGKFRHPAGPHARAVFFAPQRLKLTEPLHS